MEKTRSFVEQRRQNILAILEERGRANVADLAERLGTSALTIRRDLTALEERGEVERRYGEAVLAASASVRTEAPASPYEPQKEAIAQAAAKLVEDNELLFINTSSTALELIANITATGVTVVTNSALAQGLPIPPEGMILVTGGEVRAPRGVLSGEFALANVRSVSATTCSATVVLPDDSGPYISTMRPRGTPPMPSARSSVSEPVDIALTSISGFSPMRIIAPLPKFFSI